ncbi:uncharacterized protein F5Z01DRAFT_151313 [Emericellopsis atlantica]|uniref:Uncharacterized protein n=1 Tax=Emericellopsis atlantica TaxID=2614577 RepID=A0A9P7ZKI9_9HYPO|nr:uncharacterized protein F5Z01DRAFT_151313 [Emericellopsis atlantica]KAG9253631.1 hypothetical protein F5Z01DRAFT_151313 [Emericellopsis atlantica]
MHKVCHGDYKTTMYATFERESAINLLTPDQPVIMADQAGAFLMAICAYLGTCIIQCACSYLWTYYSCSSEGGGLSGRCFVLLPSTLVLSWISLVTWAASFNFYQQIPSSSVPPGAYGAASILGGCTAIAFAIVMHVRKKWHLLNMVWLATGAILAFCVLEHKCRYLSGILAEF